MDSDKTHSEVEDPSALSDDDWRERLSPEQFKVLRKGGTEPAFTGGYWDEHDAGLYRCMACKAPLFRSDTKYDSGTGWPSFYEPVEPGAVTEIEDRSMGMTRTEIQCSKCGSHLGHVFPDGPNPTGLRYCMNSCSLDLQRD